MPSVILFIDMRLIDTLSAIEAVVTDPIEVKEVKRIWWDMVRAVYNLPPDKLKVDRDTGAVSLKHGD